MKRERLVVLDALRAVAGLTVPLFHICEAFAKEPQARTVFYNEHGYLAVEFFLILMGYMLGFAYDRRWASGMSTGRFFFQRLRRLHPLVISGVALGLLVAFVQMGTGLSLLPWFAEKETGSLLALALWAMTMVPVFTLSLLNPFNACSWTLYYEYLANILYGLFIRRLNRKALGFLLGAALLFWLSFVFHWNLNGLFGTHVELFDKAAQIKNCSAVGGWGTTDLQFFGGCARLFLPFLLGLFLSRLNWRVPSFKGALWVALAIFLAILFTPVKYRLGGPGHLWVNGVFEFFAITVVFPYLLLLGRAAGTEAKGKAVWAFFAELSYPLYMSHYMFCTGLGIWVKNHAAAHSLPALLGIQAAVYAAFLALAFCVMKFWDRPVQAFLGRFGATPPKG